MNRIQPDDIQIHFELPPETFDIELIGADTEWFNQDVNKLHRPHGDFACLGCTNNGKDVYMIFDTNQIPEFFKRIDNSVHAWCNALYDIRQLRRYADMPDRKKIWDVQLIEQIRFSGYYDSFALNDLARRYLGIYMDKEERKSFSFNEDGKMTDDQIFYAAVDVVCTWMIAKEQRDQIDEDDLNIWTHIERPFLWCLLDTGGIKLDVEKWTARYAKDLQLAQELDEKLPFNPRSPKQVKEFFLEKYKLKLEGTAEGVLTEVAKEYPDIPELQMILDARGLAKAAGTYGKSWVDNLEDGMIYPSWKQIGAACLPKGELVLTNRGYLSSEHVVPGDYVISHLGVPQKVLQSFPNKYSKILKVYLKNGMTLRTSPYHKYLTQQGSVRVWVRADELTTDHEILCISNALPEEWKLIKDWEDFSVSSWGRVRNNNTDFILTQYPKNKWGHTKVMLFRQGAQKRGENRKDFSVHRLVADAFVSGKSTENKEVRHLNGIGWFNVSQNLCWGTSAENHSDGVQHGSLLKRYNYATKISQKDVDYIRNHPVYWGSDTDISKELPISRRYIRDIRIGERWKEDTSTGKKVEFQPKGIWKIEEDGYEMVYGLVVDEDHSHVTNGMVTHNTGRMSAAGDYAIQTVPHDESYRDCLIAEEGTTMVINDYSSQEPKLLAAVSGDRTLIKIFKDKKDVYIEVGYGVFEERFDKKDERRKSMKAIILGSIYGIGVRALAKRLNITEDVAAELLEKFFDFLPGVKKFIIDANIWKPYVTTILGRKFWGNPYSNGWGRNYQNFPMQGSAADCTKIATAKLRKNLGYNPCRIFMHDELVAVFRDEDVEMGAKALTDAMVSTQDWLHPEIPGGVETFIGKNWSAKK